MPEVTYGKETIAFTHKITKGLKYAYISVNKNEGVILKTRRMPVNEAKEIILKKAPWIIKKLAVMPEIKKQEYNSGSHIQYIGDHYQLNLIEDNSVSELEINFTGLKFDIRINPDLPEKAAVIQHYLGEFYRQEAVEKLTPRVHYWSKIMGLYPTEIKFRKLQKRWGSCTHDNKVIFNYNAIQLFELYSDYIIVHELAHIKAKNHAKEFWDIVEEYIPGCKVIHKKVLASMPY